jgi:hypothetical protein
MHELLRQFAIDKLDVLALFLPWRKAAAAAQRLLFEFHR